MKNNNFQDFNLLINLDLLVLLPQVENRRFNGVKVAGIKFDTTGNIIRQENWFITGNMSKLLITNKRNLLNSISYFWYQFNQRQITFLIHKTYLKKLYFYLRKFHTLRHGYYVFLNLWKFSFYKLMSYWCQTSDNHNKYIFKAILIVRKLRWLKKRNSFYKKKHSAHLQDAHFSNSLLRKFCRFYDAFTSNWFS